MHRKAKRLDITQWRIVQGCVTAWRKQPKSRWQRIEDDCVDMTSGMSESSRVDTHGLHQNECLGPTFRQRSLVVIPTSIYMKFNVHLECVHSSQSLGSQTHEVHIRDQDLQIIRVCILLIIIPLTVNNSAIRKNFFILWFPFGSWQASKTVNFRCS